MPAQLTHIPAPAEPSRRLRADAANNRVRILAAAGEAYAERGIDVPMAAIARRAGVGAATLYRHFPTRETLIAATFAEQFNACNELFHTALVDPDPWRGLTGLLEKVCAMQAVDKGFAAAFLAQFPKALDQDGERDRIEAGLAVLVDRAKRAGTLRPNVFVSDIMVLLLANNGFSGEEPEVALAASRRLQAFVLPSWSTAGNTAPTAQELPPPAPLTAHRLQRQWDSKELRSAPATTRR